MKKQSLWDAETKLSVCTPFPPYGTSTCLYAATLSGFPALLCPCNTELPVKHTITHCIKTTGPPMFSHLRPLTIEYPHVPTHWSSEFLMLSCPLELEAITAVCLASTGAHGMLIAAEWQRKNQLTCLS